MKYCFIFLFFLFCLAVFFADFVGAVGGQTWDKKPPESFDEETTAQVSCTNFLDYVEAVSKGMFFTLTVPQCGVPFNLYAGFNDSGFGDAFLDSNQGVQVDICLSNGNLSPEECSTDESVVQSRFFKKKQFVPPSVISSNIAVQYRPEVSAVSLDGNIFSSSVKIEYKATDENDTRGTDQERFGLGSDSVSLYYSDLIDAWDRSIIPDEDKKLIVKGLSPQGTYTWDTKAILEGDHYRVIADAADRGGDIGENISEFFSIDHTPPIFKVRADPAFTRGEKVVITVEPSEELEKAPVVAVRQRNLFPKEITMEKANGAYTGTYAIVQGYDGPATITVIGKDMAGNEGAIIAEGGRFSVGIEPPPKPLITAPLDKDIIGGDRIMVTGSAREDTKILLLVNGKDSYEASPDKDGNFVFKNIVMNKELNKGVNFLQVSARDTGGNTSEVASISVKFNLDPELVILSPKKGAIFTATSSIRIDASDKNNDKLVFSYEISKDGGKTWKVIAKEVTKKRQEWNALDFADGEYVLRVTASDGFSKKEAISEPFFIRNSLPIITFTDGERSVFGKKSFSIGGSAASPAGGAQSLITGLEYSRDDGKMWNAVGASDGAFDSFEEGFNVSFSDDEEGSYVFLFRASDARGFYGTAVKTIIIDFGPPLAPKILSPRPLSVISHSLDESSEKAGAQFTVKGESEPLSAVIITLGESSFEGSADSKGEFAVSGVTLRAHGENNVKIYATDRAGNKSKDTVFSVIYNNPPILTFLNPREGRGLGKRAVIRFDTRDPDLDQIKEVTLKYRSGSASPFTVLAKNLSRNMYEWDLSRFAEGKGYELEISASDGVTAASHTVRFAVDHTPPALSVSPFRTHIFTEKVLLDTEGNARDDSSGVEFVEFSIDGKEWFRTNVTSGYLSSSALFILKKSFILTDGTYDVGFRAVDGAGNISPPLFQKIVVDSTPPRIGSYILHHGLFIIDIIGEVFQIIQGADIAITMSFEADAKEAEGIVGQEKFPFAKNNATNLWEAVLSSKEFGTFPFLILAKDMLGNSTGEREAGMIEIVPRGRVRAKTGESIEEAEITAEIFDKENQLYVRWPGEEYGTKNPVMSGKAGEYELLLPSGRYQIRVRKQGFKRLRSDPFHIFRTQFITANFELEERVGLAGRFEELLEKLQEKIRWR